MSTQFLAPDGTQIATSTVETMRYTHHRLHTIGPDGLDGMTVIFEPKDTDQWRVSRQVRGGVRVVSSTNPDTALTLIAFLELVAAQTWEVDGDLRTLVTKNKEQTS